MYIIIGQQNYHLVMCMYVSLAVVIIPLSKYHLSLPSLPPFRHSLGDLGETENRQASS